MPPRDACPLHEPEGVEGIRGVIARADGTRCGEVLRETLGRGRPGVELLGHPLLQVKQPKLGNTSQVTKSLGPYWVVCMVVDFLLFS